MIKGTVQKVRADYVMHIQFVYVKSNKIYTYNQFVIFTAVVLMFTCDDFVVYFDDYNLFWQLPVTLNFILTIDMMALP